MEGFVEVFWVISNIGFWKPTFVNNKERGKLAYQSPQGLVDRIGEALSIIWLA